MSSEFSLPDGSLRKNAIALGADMTLSVHINNKNKDTWILDEGQTQGLHDTTLTAEGKYLIILIF